MRPHILLTGAGGQVGAELRSALANSRVTAVDFPEVDLANAEDVRNMVRTVVPDVVINTGAYTAVDAAELSPELAMSINGNAPGIIAEECQKVGALLVHYSTDYVFDGSKSSPWYEDDVPNPLNVYGKSKLEGERRVQAVGGRFLILRTSWVYGPHGKNFLLTIRRLAREKEEVSVVNDQIGAPTSSIQLARITHMLVARLCSLPQSQFPSGIYHCTAAGAVSWYGFAKMIVDELKRFERLKIATMHAISAEQYPTPAARPRNSQLCNEKLLKTFGMQIETWQLGLIEVMNRLRECEN